LHYSGKTDLPFEPYFVVGGPRTGTTILHALICTDDAVNDYIAECSYFTALIKPFLSGWTQFDFHTSAYFPGGRPEFVAYHGQLLRGVLHDIWQQVGRPKKLALKDPLLSPHIGTLAQILPETKFVLSVRDPRDVVASRITVMRKENANAAIGEHEIARICQEFNGCYAPLAKSAELFRGRALLVPYEGLSRSGDLKPVEDFMGIACRADRLWQSDLTDVNALHGKSAWHTAQYGKPLNPDSIGSYATQLTPAQIELVNRLCAPLMQQLGVAMA
jgi:hypothetical protein